MPFDLLIIVALIALNGFFALSEMAVMTSRQSRLRSEARTSKRAAAALVLAEQPDRFLSSVQVYLTVLTVLSGYFGGETLGVRLGEALDDISMIAPYSREIGVGISVALISMAFILLGELVPKRLAIVAPERIAMAVALPMRWAATAAKPAVLMLAFATDAILRLLRVRTGGAQAVTEEEIKHLVAEGAEQGVIDAHERNMVNRVLSFGDRTVDSLMTPRTDIIWLDVDAPFADNLATMRESPHSHYPVYRGSEQDVVGILQIKNLTDALGGRTSDLFRDLAEPLFVPETARALGLLEKFRETEAPVALVVDEYGDIQGLVTMQDLMLAVFGRVAQDATSDEATIVTRSEGSWLVDGRVGVDDLRELLHLGKLPHEAEQEYRTAAGLVIAHYGRIPQVGEHFDAEGYRFEVVDLDGARIDKLLIERIAVPAPSAERGD
jgi:putative hemolysin